MSEWIRCSDRLSPKFEIVLSYCKEDEEQIQTDYIIECSGKMIWACRAIHNDSRYKPSHWMPLPKIPKD